MLVGGTGYVGKPRQVFSALFQEKQDAAAKPSTSTNNGREVKFKDDASTKPKLPPKSDLQRNKSIPAPRKHSLGDRNTQTAEANSILNAKVQNSGNGDQVLFDLINESTIEDNRLSNETVIKLFLSEIAPSDVESLIKQYGQTPAKLNANIESRTLRNAAYLLAQRQHGINKANDCILRHGNDLQAAKSEIKNLYQQPVDLLTGARKEIKIAALAHINELISASSQHSGPQQDTLWPDIDYDQWFQELWQHTIDTHAGANTYPPEQLIGGSRFVNITPPQESVVHISEGPLNANHLFSSYIATQAPLMTNPDSLRTFYSMLLETDSRTVVNLTNSADEKPDYLGVIDLHSSYWPELGSGDSYISSKTEIVVKTTAIDEYDGYDIVTLSVLKKNTHAGLNQEESMPKKVKVFHFKGWPDHSIPSGNNLRQFTTFMDHVAQSRYSDNKVVHCRAGVGRSGTFIVLEQLKQGIDNGSINRDNLFKHIPEFVMKGRHARGPDFVQSKEQLQLISEQAMAYINNRF